MNRSNRACQVVGFTDKRITLTLILDAFIDNVIALTVNDDTFYVSDNGFCDKRDALSDSVDAFFVAVVSFWVKLVSLSVIVVALSASGDNELKE